MEQIKAELGTRTVPVLTEAAEPSTVPARFENPEYVSWLSGAGAVQNGGLRPPGTEGMAASKGAPKKAVDKPKPLARVEAPIAEKTPERSAQAQEKPISRDRVLGEGYFKHGETVAKVQISKTSGKPYAKVLDLETGRFEYAPGVVSQLAESDRLTVEVAAAMGRATGVCMICARELTNPESIERGIGPICAGRL